MDSQTTIAHVIVNNLGGITSLTQNLILNISENHLSQELHLLDIEGNTNTPAIIDERLNKLKHTFNLFPRDNWYHIYSKLAKALNKHKGVLISNDQYDLIMLRAFNIDRKVIQIVHDEYNLSLSANFKDCIDCFVAHSKYIYEALRRELPERSDDIVLMHYGIPILNLISKNENYSQPLKLVFLGRHVRDKGIFDLHDINQILKTKHVNVQWTILGKGPETEDLKNQWSKESNVLFQTPDTHEELMNILTLQDVLVFPTKFEGFPVAVLETMSVGCIPLASDIDGGIQEVVLNGITGYKCAAGNCQSFADKIEYLNQNRTLLIQMQQAAIKLVSDSFDIKKQVCLYQDYFKEIALADRLPKHHNIKLKIGSRLDQPFIPNLVTRYLRKLTFKSGV